MAGINIDALPIVATPAMTDVYPIDQVAVTYQVSNTQMLNLYQANASGTWAIDISGNAATATTSVTSTTATTATNATNIGITNDNATNATMFPVWVTSSSGNLPAKVSSSKVTFNPSTGVLAPVTISPSAQGAALNMNSHQINNVTDGVAAQDAVTVSQLAASASPLTTKGDLYTFTTVNARLPVGTTNGQLLQVNSATATGLQYTTATYPTTATNVARILRSDATNWVESTSTFADTYAASSILYANGANNVAGLTTANNGLPVTGNTGVPVMLAGPGTSRNLLMSNAAAAPSFTTETYAVPGTSGNVMTSDGTNWTSAAPAGSATSVIVDDTTTNATMYPVWVTAATGSLPLKVSSTKMTFNPSTGRVTAAALAFSPTTGGILGTTTNDSVATGYVGEIVTAAVTAASATAISSATPVNITSISLTAGQWLVVGNGGVTFAGTNGTFAGFWISTTSATLPDGGLRAGTSGSIAGSVLSHAVPPKILQLSATTTVYLSCQCTFPSSTATRYGEITATRIR